MKLLGVILIVLTIFAFTSIIDEALKLPQPLWPRLVASVIYSTVAALVIYAVLMLTGVGRL